MSRRSYTFRLGNGNRKRNKSRDRDRVRDRNRSRVRNRFRDGDRDGIGEILLCLLLYRTLGYGTRILLRKSEKWGLLLNLLLDRIF